MCAGVSNRQQNALCTPDPKRSLTVTSNVYLVAKLPVDSSSEDSDCRSQYCSNGFEWLGVPDNGICLMELKSPNCLNIAIGHIGIEAPV